MPRYLRLILPLSFAFSIVLSLGACESQRSPIADSCYQPLYWPSEACPPEAKVKPRSWRR